jgi:enoyl-CoA hydratase/carnithine racemase
MADDQQAPGMVQRLELSAGENDAERLGRLRRALRDADQSAVLVIAGSFEGDPTDPNVHGDTLNLLLDASLPVLAAISGPVGPRGFGLLLSADHMILGPGARMTGNWRAAPGATALLHHRFGPPLARRMTFDPVADPLKLLADCGFAARADDPSAEIQNRVAGLAENGLGRRLKRTLRASSEMPLKEALAFDLWFTRTQDGNAR